MGARAFAAAEQMIGIRFRSQGRDRVRGVDCVGLVWAAYAAAGVRLRSPQGYPLRGWSLGRVEAGLAQSGLMRVAESGVGLGYSQGLIGDVALR